MSQHYRLTLALAVAFGLAVLGPGCESEEIKAARLDAEAKWAAALEARAAIPTEDRIENAKIAADLARKKHRAARTAAHEAIDAAARAAGEPWYFLGPGPVRAAAQEKAYSDPEYVATEEALRLAENELSAAVREREAAVELAQALTVAAEEATAFLEAGKRAKR